MLEKNKLYLKLFFSCFCWSAFWVALMALIRYQDMVDVAGNDELWTVFFSIIGVIYAITVAFLLVLVLEKFNRFASTVLDEINLIQDIRDFLILIKVTPDIQRKLYCNLLNYAKNIYTYEWERMKKINNKKKKKLESDTCTDLYEVIKNVAQLEPVTTSGKIALKEIVSNIGNITTIRTKRIELSKEALSPILYIYIRFMGIMLNVPFILFNGGNIWIQGGMVVAVASAIRILFGIIKDFDSPLTGFWNVDESILKDFVKKEEDKDLNKIFFDEFVVSPKKLKISRKKLRK